MIATIERMLTDLERGKLTRRQFAVSIATLAAGSLAAPGALQLHRRRRASGLSV